MPDCALLVNEFSVAPCRDEQPIMCAQRYSPPFNELSMMSVFHSETNSPVTTTVSNFKRSCLHPIQKYRIPRSYNKIQITYGHLFKMIFLVLGLQGKFT